MITLRPAEYDNAVECNNWTPEQLKNLCDSNRIPRPNPKSRPRTDFQERKHENSDDRRSQLLSHAGFIAEPELHDRLGLKDQWTYDKIRELYEAEVLRATQ